MRDAEPHTVCVSCDVDCGAGIGRVSRHLLVRHFDTVDLVEPVEKLLDRAANDVSSARKEIAAERESSTETKSSHAGTR